MSTNIDTSKEILFASSDAVVSRKISQLEKAGTLKKIALQLSKISQP